MEQRVRAYVPGLCLAALGCAGSGFFWRDVHQRQLKHALVRARQYSEADRVETLLEQGADANTSTLLRPISPLQQAKQIIQDKRL